jgi:hypothetical protein
LAVSLVVLACGGATTPPTVIGEDASSDAVAADAARDSAPDGDTGSDAADARTDRSTPPVVCNGVTCPSGFKCCASANGPMCAPDIEC